MTHLAENSAVGRNDALNGVIGIIGVKGDIVGCVAAEINILSYDLTIGGKLLDERLIGNKSALAVRNGNGVNFALLRF